MKQYSLIIRALEDNTASARSRAAKHLAQAFQISEEVVEMRLKDLPATIPSQIQASELENIKAALETLGVISVFEELDASQPTDMPEAQIDIASLFNEEPLEEIEVSTESPAAAELTTDEDSSFDDLDLESEKLETTAESIEAADLTTTETSDFDNLSLESIESIPEHSEEGRPSIGIGQTKIDPPDLNAQLSFDEPATPAELEPKSEPVSPGAPVASTIADDFIQLEESEEFEDTEMSYEPIPPVAGKPEELEPSAPPPLSNFEYEEEPLTAADQVETDIDLSPSDELQESLAEMQMDDIEPVKKPDNQQIKLFGALGLMLVAALCYWLLGPSSEPSVENISKGELSIQDLLAQQKLIKEESAKSLLTFRNDKLQHWKGEADSTEITTKIAVATKKGVLQSLEFRVETPSPPKLTPQERVDRVPERPWLVRFEISEIIDDEIRSKLKESIEKAQPQTYRTKGKAYVTTGKKSTRLIADAVIIASVEKQENLLKGSWRISFGSHDSAAEKQNSISAAEDGSVAFYYTGSFSASSYTPTEPQKKLEE